MTDSYPQPTSQFGLPRQPTAAKQAAPIAKKKAGDGRGVFLRITCSVSKEAASYEFQGDVQGVHLRATLHNILNHYKLPGMAYNDARTGEVFATIRGARKKRQEALKALETYLDHASRVKSYSITEHPHKELLQKVMLDPVAQEKFFTSQGFSYLPEGADPATYRRQWLQKRYRLADRNGSLVGKMPELAAKQLQGLEPVYAAQLTDPGHFGPNAWNQGLKAAAEPEKPEHPFTIAMDLDGTLAENLETFDINVIGPVRPKAKAWLDTFKEHGARICIFTVRGNKEQIATWLKDNDIPYDYINENPDQPEGSSGKIIADAYFDDRAVNAVDLDTGGEQVLGMLAAAAKEACAWPLWWYDRIATRGLAA